MINNDIKIISIENFNNFSGETVLIENIIIIINKNVLSLYAKRNEKMQILIPIPNHIHWSNECFCVVIDIKNNNIIKKFLTLSNIDINGIIETERTPKNIIAQYNASIAFIVCIFISFLFWIIFIV